MTQTKNSLSNYGLSRAPWSTNGKFCFAYVEVITYKKHYLGVVLLRSPRHRKILGEI